MQKEKVYLINGKIVDAEKYRLTRKKLDDLKIKYSLDNTKHQNFVYCKIVTK